MKLEFEYGQGLLGAELPDSTDIFIPGETVADPPCLPQDWDSLYAATLASIRNPIGMPPLKELAGPAIEAVKKGETKFVPERFDKVYYNWMNSIRDWCISRQLWWGHRIPAWACADCGEIVVSRETPAACPKCGGSSTAPT